jgi:uncharacterized protein (UPF0332 family)
MEEEGMRRTVQQLLDMFVEPEIKRRQAAGEVEKPFPLTHAQIIFYPDGRPSEVRLNEEIRTVVKVKLKEPLQKPIRKGDPVYLDQIESVETTSLAEDEDPNVGHATLLSLNGSWVLHFDFIYNKQKSAQHLAAARQFVEAARHGIEKKHWAVVVDALCSASELTAKAYLLGSPDKTIMEAKSHGIVASRANAQRKLGNLQSHHVESFNKVWGLRTKARYLQGELDFSEAEAVDIMNTIDDFIADVQQRIDIASNK